MTKAYNPDVIERAAFDALDKGLTSNGITLVYAHQHNFQGVPPYATLSIDSRAPQGQPDRIHLSDTGIMALYGTRIGGGTIMCVGDDAGDMADRIVNWMTTSFASGEMYRAGIVIHSAQPVPMMPIELDGQVWQQACAVDFQYRVGVVYDDDVGLISVVNLKSRIDTIEGELWFNIGDENPLHDFRLIGQSTYDAHSLAPRPIIVHLPKGGTYKSATWASSDYSIVDFSTDPHALRLGDPGNAVITVTILKDDDTEISHTLDVRVVETVPQVGVEYMTIDAMPPYAPGNYPPPHHTVHTNRKVISYEYRSNNLDVMDFTSAPIHLDLKKAGVALLTIRAYFDDGGWVEAHSVIQVT